MARPSEDDREAVDRVFAEMVASYHLTADRPEPATVAEVPPEPPAAEPETTWHEVKPTFRFVESPPAPPVDEAPAPEAGGYEPEPLPPLRRPGIPALVGWIGMAYAVFVVLAGTFGVNFPTWAGWLAITGFIGGFGILITRLPRNRPPGSGDGAVV